MNNLLCKITVISIANVITLYIMMSDVLKNKLLNGDGSYNNGSINKCQWIWTGFICMFYLILIALLFLILSLCIQIRSKKKINPFYESFLRIQKIFFGKNSLYFYIILLCICLSNFIFMIYNYIIGQTEEKDNVIDTDFIYYWSMHLISLFLLCLLFYFTVEENNINLGYICIYLIFNFILIVTTQKNNILLLTISIVIISLFPIIENFVLDYINRF